MQTGVADGDHIYTISFDEEISAGNRPNALVQGRVLDELTGKPVTSNVLVAAAGTAFDKTAARANVASRVASGGIVGLVGVPATVFPKLTSQAYEAGLTVRSEGYLPIRVVRPLGPQPEFPLAFAALALGDIELHSTPIMVRGRTVQRTSAGVVPAPNATVRVKGLWRRIPASNVVVAPDEPNLVNVDPPMYLDRNHSTAKIRAVSVGVSGDVKTTVDPAGSGSTLLRVSDGTGLSVGDAILIDGSHSGAREIAIVSQINGSVSGAGPASVRLKYSLKHAYARGTAVRKATISASGTEQTLSLNAIAEDTTLVCASAAELADETFLEISSPASENEYHWLRPYVVTSDANGDYRLPPISRVAQIVVEAELAGHSPVSHVVGLQYPAHEQFLDFTFA